MRVSAASSRGFELARWGVTFAGFVFLAACAMRPLAAVDGLAIPDDGYICLEIARNLGSGRGATFAGIATNGFQPLWVLLLAPMFALVPRAHPDAYVHVSLLLGALFASLTFFLLAGWFRDRPRPFAWVVPLGAFWFPSGAVVQNALNAMETSLALFLVTAILTALRALDGKALGVLSPRHAIALGVLLGLGVLARMDIGLLAVALALAWVVDGVRARDPSHLARLALTAGTALAITAPWWVWSQVATGSWFPVSGRAIRVCSLGTPRAPDLAFHLLMLDRAWLTWRRHYGASIQWVLAALVVASLVISDARRAWASELRRRTGIAAVLFALALVAVYVGYFFAPWFFRRYFFPLQLALAWLFVGAASSLLGALRHRHHATLASIVLTLAALGANLSHRLTRRMLTLDDARSWSYRNVGLWAARYFPPGTVVGAGQTGALAYYAPSLRVVNLDGVVSAPAYDAMLRNDLLGYARRRGVRYTLGWRQDSEFFRANSRPADRTALRKVFDVPEIRSWGYAWEVCALDPRDNGT
jgi:4-amino-4-deoxy-L-arabinose transferase-like glycosyltransferase